MTSPHRLARTALFVVAASALPAISAGQPAPQRTVKNPPRLTAAPKAVPEAGAAMAPAGSGTETTLDLNVVYTDGQIWNPAANRYDKVRLRSYQGAAVDPATPYISPSIEVRPGDTLQMTLHNQLPVDPTCVAGSSNNPHCFNGTNLHTHGLWVNPGGNGDNVLLSINPGVSFDYEYKIPPEHPSGTFWYHTHRHGSTALQVSSGMAGALIVRGNRAPTTTVKGDIDTLLRATPAQPFTERIVVMQQIQYACRDKDGNIKYVDPKNKKDYLCDEGDVGGVEGYDQFGPNTWSDSGRYTSLNGNVLPTFTGAKAGKVERWRMIHGGVRDTINLEFRPLKAATSTTTALRASDADAFIGQNCNGAALPQHLIAADGLTLDAVLTTDVTVFQPGYRWDALLTFPAAGTYCVIDTTAPVSAVGSPSPSRQLLGFVTVQPGDTVAPDPTSYLRNALIEAARRNMPAPVQDAVIADLRTGLSLHKFAPHDDVEVSDVTGTQTLTFNIDVKSNPVQFQVDGHPYDPSKEELVRKLTLHAVDEWTLTSTLAGHPFHIHVNPFQVVRILDPDGKDVSEPGSSDTFGAPAGTVDAQYRGLKGVWKDTLWVKNAGGKPYTLVVRTRYRRYIGDFVLHCHILDHEDQGMMQNVRIVLPGGAHVHK